MTQAEIEALLQAAFNQCEAAGYPLGVEQQQILLNSARAGIEANSQPIAPANSSGETDESNNPLDELTPDQRRTFLEFVRGQKGEDVSWKAQLMNDWLAGRESGELQFIRDRYGIQWLDRIQPVHLARYSEELAMNLKVGDRIEVSNSLWEWVQEDGPCQREWIACTVVSVSEAPENMPMVPPSYRGYTSCTVRFNNGMEYEIQGVYEWNRYNWRWMENSD
jgi:hypothetical protein